ncbi:MAG: DUF2634 domain-containing protein [Clostridiales bacterium]|nr:DUF2634 domain-containing protein [Clostridiales bacterium]
MIPISVDDFDERVFNFDSVSFTYGIKYEQNKIKEYIDGLNAVKQAIYKILMTERGVFEIYDSEFGIALSDLFGKSVSYARSELPTRIENALLYDDRIKKVYDFSFPDVKEKGILSVKFFVLSVFGEEEFTLEVNI